MTLSGIEKNPKGNEFKKKLYWIDSITFFYNSLALRKLLDACVFIWVWFNKVDRLEDVEEDKEFELDGSWSRIVAVLPDTLSLLIDEFFPLLVKYEQNWVIDDEEDEGDAAIWGFSVNLTRDGWDEWTELTASFEFDNVELNDGFSWVLFNVLSFGWYRL